MSDIKVTASLAGAGGIYVPPSSNYDGRPIKNDSPFALTIYGADNIVTLQPGEEACFKPNDNGGWLIKTE